MWKTRACAPPGRPSTVAAREPWPLDVYKRQVLGIAKAVFETAIDEKIITDNPFGRVKKPRGTAGTHRSLSNDEVQWMCDHWREYRMGLAYMVMIFAGLRIGEVIALTPQAVSYTHL